MNIRTHVSFKLLQLLRLLSVSNLLHHLFLWRVDRIFPLLSSYRTDIHALNPFHYIYMTVTLTTDSTLSRLHLQWNYIRFHEILFSFKIRNYTPAQIMFLKWLFIKYKKQQFIFFQYCVNTWCIEHFLQMLIDQQTRVLNFNIFA